ncbi:cell division protein FtsQ/DivIB [bacterium]|nr:cell division protein FtsQ/DivIB [bacterium]
MSDENEEFVYSEEYIKQRMLQNKKERHSRKSFTWLKRLRKLLRFLMVVGLIFGLYFSLRLKYWYMSPNAFNSVHNGSLEIVNNNIVPSVNILRALRQHPIPRIPIYLYNTDILKKDIMLLEPVEDVYIRRFWMPARLLVIIKERKPIITISPAPDVEPVAFFAKGGKLIGKDYLPLDPKYKTIRVLSYGVRGDDYRHWTPEKIALIEKIAKTTEAYTKSQIKYIDFRNPEDVYVQLPEVNIRLGEIDDTIFNRLKRLPSILPQIVNLDKKIKYLDLRWDNANYIKLED